MYWDLFIIIVWICVLIFYGIDFSDILYIEVFRDINCWVEGGVILIWLGIMFYI